MPIPDRRRRRRCGEGVHHVERAAERRRDTLAAPGEGERRRRDLDVGDVVDAERHHLDRGGVDEQTSMMVVDVDDPDDGATWLEQQRLGPEVLLDGAVQVEMVASEVGEHGGVEPGSVDAMQGEGVRRDLHHDRSIAPVTEFGEAGLQLRRLRCRVGARQRADDARRVARRAQDRGEEHARRRLAVRPGDADDPERRRRVAVDRSGDRPEGQPGVVDDQLGDVRRRPRTAGSGRRATTTPRRPRRRGRTSVRRGARRAGRRTSPAP